MEFRKVTELVPGTKYRIKGTVYPCDTTGTYISTTAGSYYCENIGGRRNWQFFNYVTFYEPIFQSHNIQTTMEQRAVNLILRRVIGDDSFTW